MKFREHINKAVFGLVAAALQLLPGEGKAEENECADIEAALEEEYLACTESGNATASECHSCLQQSGFTMTQQALTDCLGSESLKSYTNYYPAMCDNLSGGVYDPPQNSSGATN
jgi:hypothetical protein